MRRHAERAMYVHIEDALSSITTQLRSAIDADARTASGANGNVHDAASPLRRAGWARQVAAELGSVLIYTLGLAATIEWHLQQFRKCTSIPCELTVSHAAGVDLPEDCTETIFDIYQEAVSNVARHAGATRVAIALTIMPQDVTLVVHDNGIGLSDEASRSDRGGIAGMRARAHGHNGLCRFAGARDTGTTVTASLPFAHTPC